jgi:hypothetical protein
MNWANTWVRPLDRLIFYGCVIVEKCRPTILIVREKSNLLSAIGKYIVIPEKIYTFD